MKFFNFIIVVSIAFLVSCDIQNDGVALEIDEDTKVELSIESSIEIKNLKEEVNQEINSAGLRMEENYIDNADWLHVLRDPKEELVNYTLPLTVKKYNGSLIIRNLIIVKDKGTEKLSYAVVNIRYDNGQTGFTIHDLEKERVFSNRVETTSGNGRRMMFCIDIAFDQPWTIFVGEGDQEVEVNGSTTHYETICSDDGGGPLGGTEGGSEGGGFFPIPISGGGEGGNNDADISLVDNPEVEEEIEAHQWENNNIELSEEFENSPCASDVMEKLESGDALYSVVKNFAENTFNLNLKLEFDVNDYYCDPMKSCRGKINQTSNGFKITLHSDYLNEASPLAVEKTIMHESIHAHLYYYIKVVKGNQNISLSDFPGIYDYASRYPQDWQHQQMAQHYRDVIIGGMSDFDAANGTNYSSAYTALSWSGLKGTVAWNDLSSSQKTAYENTYRAEDVKGGCE